MEEIGTDGDESPLVGLRIHVRWKSWRIHNCIGSPVEKVLEEKRKDVQSCGLRKKVRQPSTRIPTGTRTRDGHDD